MPKNLIIKIAKKIKKSKKPIVIIGESALQGKAGEYIFENIKNFLFINNFINEDVYNIIESWEWK